MTQANNESSLPDILGLPLVAKRLGRSVKSIERMIDKYEIRACRLHNRWVVKLEDYLAFIRDLPSNEPPNA